MNDQFAEIQDMLVGMVTNVAGGAIEFLPKLVGAFAVLLLGWIIARVLRAILVRSIQVSLDALLERSGLMEALERASITAQPSQIVGGVAYWLVLILFVMGAAEIVGMTAVTAAITVNMVETVSSRKTTSAQRPRRRYPSSRLRPVAAA